MVNAETLTTLLTETCFMFLTDPDRLSVRMVSASHHYISIAGSRFTLSESQSIPACPAVSNGVYGLTFLFRLVHDEAPFQPWFWEGYP
jgi:hypothetical protein